MQKGIAILLLLMSCLAAQGKDKKKVLLPDDVLEARTVYVLIDPDAGESLDAPNANRTAREDVEKALMKWGRFSLTMDASSADLVISVRKGNGKVAQPTIGGIPNDRPVIVQTTDSGGRIGGSRGVPPGSNPAGSRSPGPAPQVEVGSTDDVFAVYRGKFNDNVLNAPPVWRLSAKDALRSPSVPAVDAFRKVIIEAEKQRASRP